MLATLRELWNVTPLTERDKHAASFLAELSGTARADTIAKLPRLPAVDGVLANASLPLADPLHPANQPTDDTQDEIVEGWRDRMRRLMPEIRQSFMPDATHGGAHEFVCSSVLRYLDLRARLNK
jgi:hypothetical protein